MILLRAAPWLVLAALALSCSPPDDTPLSSPAETAQGVITADVLAAPVAFLSDDLLEGRGPATRGDELARGYIEASLRWLGLEPGAADGQWQQPFEIVGLESDVPETWRFSGAGEVSLAWWDEFIAWSGVQQSGAVLDEAALVFVGYAMQAPEYSWDDFKDADLRGKVLVMLNNDPDWDPELFEGSRRLYYGRWDYKYESAARQGAVGAILIHTRPSAGYPWQVVQSSWTGEQFELPAEGEPRLQVAAWITEPAARRLVAAAGQDLDRLVESAKSPEFRPVELGLRTSLEIDCSLSRVQTANVLGHLKGRDPRLAREAVVYTAHHDHIGVGEPDSEGDRIYNGALDNAAGVAQMLAVARAFAALPRPPRRSILFLAVAAEEQGLLGSEYYATHPTVHPGRIAANINIDGGNIWGRTEDLPLIGHGKSSLDAVAAEAAGRQGRELVPEAFPDRGFFYRSDQFNFAKIGVPALYADCGNRFVGRPGEWGREQIELWEGRHYHQPSDEIDESWDFSGMVEDARWAFAAGWAVAEADELPAWNPGDEFEEERRRALESVPAE